MPPWAATVWLRVGNTFVMQAVVRPALDGTLGGTQTGPPGTDHNHIKRMVDEVVGACRTHVFPDRPGLHADLQHGVDVDDREDPWSRPQLCIE